jgi:hypothetical protein
MKTFEVIVTHFSRETVKPYETPDNEVYYIKDDKVCFRCKRFKETKKYIVDAFNEDGVEYQFSKTNNTIESIKLIKEEETMYDNIAKTTAGQDWCRFIDNGELLEKVFVEEYDEPCSSDVQMRYKALGRIPPTTYSDF